MNSELTNLPDDTLSLKQIISSQKQQIDYLQEMVRLLKNELFGRKSESLPATGHNQIPLFETNAAIEPVPDDNIVVPAHTRKKRGRKPLPADLPRVDVLHDLSDEDKRCACGAELSRIGEATCEKLDYVPAKLQVVRHIRPKYACKACEGVEDDGPTVKIAPPPVQRVLPASVLNFNGANGLSYGHPLTARRMADDRTTPHS